MPDLKNKIIIDTNLWISFFIKNDFSKLEKLITDKSVTLIFSSELIQELITVSRRKKFAKFFDTQDIEKMLLSISSKIAVIEVNTIATECRDPKDNFLLSLAIDGDATHLLTGDKDLLEMKNYGKTLIITFAEYIEYKAESN